MGVLMTAALVPVAATSRLVSNGPYLFPLNLDTLKSFFHIELIKAVFHLVWHDPNTFFLTILALRYYRLIIHIYAKYFLYRPFKISANPVYLPEDVHVIIPTIDPENADFIRCIESCIKQNPGAITIATAGPLEKEQTARDVLSAYANQQKYKHISFNTVHASVTNKRAQLVAVIESFCQTQEDIEANKDKILVFVDDHVWWPSPLFFAHLLAPFESPYVGLVGTNKQPQRDRGHSFKDSVLNLVACIYLERHNFDITSTYAIDGGAFVISARTCAIRACIAMEEEFRRNFTDEYFWTPWGKAGPLNPDDDNFITRYIIKKGWRIGFQCGKDALMETTLGTTGGYKKFTGQIFRWARSQWRSNSCSIFRDRVTWTRYPWTAFIMYLGTMFNFAAIWDTVIVYSWYNSSYAGFHWYYLVAILLGSKLVKTFPFFCRNPQDIWMFPFLVLFGYLHSWVKFWALLTYWDHSWGGRKLPTQPLPAENVNNTSRESTPESEGEPPWSRPDSRASSHCSDTSSVSSHSSISRPRPALAMSVNTRQHQILNDRNLLSALSSGSMPMSISSGPSPVSPIFPHPPSRTAHSSLASSDSFTRNFGKNYNPENKSINVFTPSGTGNSQDRKSVSKTPKTRIATLWEGVSPTKIHVKSANVRETQLEEDLVARQAPRFQFKSNPSSPESSSQRFTFLDRPTSRHSAGHNPTYGHDEETTVIDVPPTTTFAEICQLVPTIEAHSPHNLSSFTTSPDSRRPYYYRSEGPSPVNAMSPSFKNGNTYTSTEADRSLPQSRHMQSHVRARSGQGSSNLLFPMTSRPHRECYSTALAPPLWPTRPVISSFCTVNLNESAPGQPVASRQDSLSISPRSTPHPQSSNHFLDLGRDRRYLDLGGSSRHRRLDVPYARNFTRGNSCERLHGEYSDLRRPSLRRCLKPEVPNAGQEVLRGRRI